jgi:hypothetical protein
MVEDWTRSSEDGTPAQFLQKLYLVCAMSILIPGTIGLLLGLIDPGFFLIFVVMAVVLAVLGPHFPWQLQREERDARTWRKSFPLDREEAVQKMGDWMASDGFAREGKTYRIPHDGTVVDVVLHRAIRGRTHVYVTPPEMDRDVTGLLRQLDGLFVATSSQ